MDTDKITSEITTSAPASTAAAAPAAPEPVTLTEFCQRLSHSDKRVELIGGFHHSEVAAGHVKDAESAFAARFDAFVNKPV